MITTPPGLYVLEEFLILLLLLLCIEFCMQPANFFLGSKGSVLLLANLLALLCFDGET